MLLRGAERFLTWLLGRGRRWVGSDWLDGREVE